jgi:hypothetical protein
MGKHLTLVSKVILIGLFIGEESVTAADLCVKGNLILISNENLIVFLYLLPKMIDGNLSI